MTLPGDDAGYGNPFRFPMDEAILATWLAVLQRHSPSLHSLVFRNPLSPGAWDSLPRLTSVTTLTLRFLFPFSLYEVAKIIHMPAVTHLSLKMVGPLRQQRAFPGHHLGPVHIDQGKANIVDLKVTGDVGACFWFTAFFASASLRCYAADINIASTAGSYAALQIWRSIHVLSVRSERLESMKIVNHTPLQAFGTVGFPARYMFDDVFLQDFSKLRNLRFLEIIDVEFANLHVTHPLITSTRNMQHLKSIRLSVSGNRMRPQPGLFPPLDVLAQVATMHPSLTSLSMPVSLETIPPPWLNPTPLTPPPALKKLLLFTESTSPRLTVADSIALARYLHSVFPHLEDLTSLSPNPVPAPLDGDPRQAAPQPENLWEAVESLLKLMRRT